ncbi:NAD(P)/FAD-dependent oxidoreductase [Aquipuribacter hungaricus]|uniref:NAD(P)/FAD-dependent oxidoreductase n=1 Tax=Aquipuribacter hungaricus TaxID=545624 RepID=A0ABV7WGM7_9MICO
MSRVDDGGRADVVVVGAGVVGASVAFHLAEAGADVVVLERDEPASGSSGKPVGGVRAQFSDPLNVTLGARSLQAYAAFGDRPGADIGLQRVGYLFLLPTEDDVGLFRASVAVQNALGVPSRLVGLDEAAALNPWLDTSRYAGAAWCDQDGWAHPAAVVRGYLDAASRLGARVRTRTEVTGVRRDGDRVTGVRTTAGTVATGTVVCCAGAWSQAVGAMAGVHLPVVPLRRQIALTGPPPARGARAPLPFTIDFGSTYYCHDAADTAVDPGAGLLLGIADPATRPGPDRSYDEAWLPTLRAAARRCTPGLADLPVRSGWAGLYEMTPDHDALLGRAAGVEGFLYATGFSGHGFLQAPAVGEVLRDLVLGVPPPVDVSALHADRFDGARPVRAEANII